MLIRLSIGLQSLVEVALRRSRIRTMQIGDRGDVPGWVLVAVMTAGLVTAIWLVADDALTSVFNRAMSSISGHS